MTDQSSIFNKENENQETPETQEKPSQSDAYNDLLKQITNEKGEQKYKTLEDALVGLKHAQEYIPKLKQEKSQEEQELIALRAEMQRLASLEETVLELTKRREEPPTSGKNLSEEEIAALIENTLTAKQQKSIQESNIKTVVKSLTDRFGDKAEEMFNSKATELGLSIDDMNALAAKTPKAVLTMLGISGEGAHKQPGFTPSTGTINASAFTPRADSFVGKSQKNIMLGATTQDIMEEAENARNLVEELHSQGLSVDVLTNPKEYFKRFK